MKIMIAGSGAWGTALAINGAQGDHTITLWSHSEEKHKQLVATRCCRQLPHVRIPDNVTLTDNLDLAIAQDIIVIATPSYAVHDLAGRLATLLPPEAVVVSVAKGLDRENNYCRFSETIGAVCKNPVVVLTGPTHAEEVATLVPSTILAASENRRAAELVQEAFMNPSLRVYTGDDVIGAELGGAFKNVIALAAGACDGMGFGDNTKAALMTRGLTEIARLGVALGGKSETFAGLSGMGDLIVTCTSMHSRNRRAGILIGQGKSPMEAMNEVGAVVEGYYATGAGYHLAKKAGIEMPIVEGIYKALYEEADAKEVIYVLLSRKRKNESEEVWR